MNIKGLGRVSNLIANKQASILKDSFVNNLPLLIKRINNNQSDYSDSTVIGFSGNKYFYEQLYSALSFLKNIGIPKKWIIINDGTYEKYQIDILEGIGGIKILNFDFNNSEKFKGFKELSNSHIWGKIFYAYFNMLDQITETTIFCEADILIFEGIKQYLHLFKKKNYYLADTDAHFDSFFIAKYSMPMLKINNGFSVFNTRPPLEIAYNYMMERIKENNFEYFTPQSAFQLMIEQDFDHKFFDPRYFVVNCSDHFKIGIDHFPGKKINKNYPGPMAIRHFVGPVRHKMWQTDWREVLGF